MLEDESVLTRREHLEAAGSSGADVEALLHAIAVIAEPIRISCLWRPVLPHPDDDLLLETAVSGRAGTLITFNRRPLAPATAPFGLDVVLPADAVRRSENC